MTKGGRRRNDGGEWEVAGGRRRCSGLFFSGCWGAIRGAVLSGRGAWRRSGLFRFVRICSGLFGVRRSGAGVDGVKFWQPLSTLVNLVSTSVKFWSALASAWLPAVAWGVWRRRCCGERGMVVALLFWCERSRNWGNRGCGGSCLRRNDGRGAGMTGEAQE